MKPRFLAVALCLVSLPSFAAWRAGVDSVKVVVKKHSGAVSPALPIPAAVIGRFGGRVVSERGDAMTIEVPRAAAQALQQALAKDAQSVEIREDLDVVKFSTYPIDARRGEPSYPDGWTVEHPTASTARDTFVIQFAASPKTEWLEAIKAAGLKIIDYVPENAYVVFGSEAAVAQLEAAVPVQFAARHQPVHKIAADVRDAADAFVDATVVLAEVPEAGETRAFLDMNANGELRPVASAGDRTLHTVRLSGPSLRDLARMPGVIWIEKAPHYELSGERDAYLVNGDTLTTLSGGVLRPATPTNYRTWLSGKGVSNYTSAVKVGIIDTGVDMGSTTNIHSDFHDGSGTFVEFADYTSNQAGSLDDCIGHGTMVAGVIAGNAGGTSASTTRDIGSSFGDSNYLMGLGVAPAIPIVSGKMSFGAAQFIPQALTTIYPNLAGRGVSIVNNSFNDYNAAGTYTADARTLDLLARHVNQNDTGAGMAIYYSAGNTNQYSGTLAGSTLVAAPATAKNVVAVGGTESYNPITSYTTRDAYFNGTNSDNGADIFALSARGAADGRIKPDVVAPASAIESTGTRLGLCENFSGEQVGVRIDNTAASPHVWDRGTSFSSPNAVGHAALLSTWYRNTHSSAAPSPAMLKAMQINFAYDLPTRPHAPEAQQGWGKVDSTRAFKTDGRYIWSDQALTVTPSTSIVWLPSLFGNYTIKDTSRPVRITLVWTDRAGANGANPALVNDLNLIVFSTGSGATAVGNSFNSTTGRSNVYVNQTLPYDHANNVEQVVVNSSDVGQYFRIEVWGSNVTGDAINPWLGTTAQQDFALFIENAY